MPIYFFDQRHWDVDAVMQGLASHFQVKSKDVEIIFTRCLTDYRGPQCSQERIRIDVASYMQDGYLPYHVRYAALTYLDYVKVAAPQRKLAG